MRKLMTLGLMIALCFAAQARGATVGGELKVWHKVTVTFTGPTCSESSSPNPFRNYRLDVTFTGPSAQVYKVPGYFCADGNAAETSATSGNKWRVNFCPDEAGQWSYVASFVTGSDIAAELTGGAATGFNGDNGSFTVTASDKTAPDLRARGKLEYVGEHYLQFANCEYFLKVGANSPEVFLEYQDFDGTPSSRTYSTHVGDWNTGDPTWKGTKGKGIIGVVNYLASQGVNAHYFLTMNSLGDGKNAYPWTDDLDIWEYDCSKLDQWEIVFEHFDRKGLMLHFQMTETENQSLFEYYDSSAPLGGFAKSRKIYYREMVARFGHHLAVTWNVGEENGWDHGSTYGEAITTTQRKQFADRIRALTYYDDHITVHNGPSGNDTIFDGIVGYASYTGPSIQQGLGTSCHGKVLEWRNSSAGHGHKWAVCLDEPYTGGVPGTDTARKYTVWGALMAGGAGAEHYIGGGRDLTIQDYRDYAALWAQMGYAHAFFEDYVPFSDMAPNDSLISGTSNWCLAGDGIYVFYLPAGGSQTVTLPAGSYVVSWFDPRNGGALIPGGALISVGGGASLGTPPNSTTSDWAALAELGEPIDPPHLEFDRMGLGGGLHGWLFRIANEDGLLAPYTVQMGFIGVDGATIHQLLYNGMQIHSETFANIADGQGGYAKLQDTWVFAPFGDNTVPGINPLTGGALTGFYEAANAFAFSCWSGSGSTLGDNVNLAYVVADGNVGFAGTITREGTDYDVLGVTDYVPPELPGDYSGDGTVSGADYVIWADSFGNTGLPGQDMRADGNGDGLVSGADYVIWAGNFGADSQ